MTVPAATSDLAFLTADMPGVGGRIKKWAEDFRVHEQPLTQPAGEGEHIWLHVEKCNQTTFDAAERIAKLFRVRRSAVSYAGLKDKRAICRQVFSVHLPGAGIPRVPCERFVHTPMTLLWADRHTRKLRRGHHAGNRFLITLRDVDPAAIPAIEHVLRMLETRGAPNYIGAQRFGFRQNNHLLGRLLIEGDYPRMLDEMLGRPRPYEMPQLQEARAAYDAGQYARALELWPRRSRHDRQALDALRRGLAPREAVFAIDRQQCGFFLSALQSAVFNRVLDQRLREGTFDRLIEGDLAWKHDSRAVFTVDAATAELENSPGGRAPALAVSPSGPMWGLTMTRPTAAALDGEVRALRDLGLTPEQWEAGVERLTAESGRQPPETDGARRPLRVPVRHIQVSAGRDAEGPCVRVGFELPRGSFATMVLRELMKIESTDAERGD